MYDDFMLPFLVKLSKRYKRVSVVGARAMMTSRHDEGNLLDAWRVLRIGEPTYVALANVLNASVGKMYATRAHTYTLRRRGRLYGAIRDASMADPEKAARQELRRLLAGRKLKESELYAAYLAADPFENGVALLECCNAIEDFVLTPRQFRAVLGRLKGFELVKTSDLRWSIRG